jgi:hypothetical protein
VPDTLRLVLAADINGITPKSLTLPGRVRQGVVVVTVGATPERALLELWVVRVAPLTISL